MRSLNTHLSLTYALPGTFEEPWSSPNFVEKSKQGSRTTWVQVVNSQGESLGQWGLLHVGLLKKRICTVNVGFVGGFMLR
jgi:hypothetical protein